MVDGLGETGLQEREKREARREAALERHKRLSALSRKDRLGFERERKRMIHELIESAEDGALKKKPLDFQANWDRKMKGAGSQHNRFILAHHHDPREADDAGRHLVTLVSLGDGYANILGMGSLGYPRPRYGEVRRQHGL